MMNYSVGNLEKKAAVAAFSELTGTTSADIANNTTPAHSAQRSDDTFAAKSNREVLGFALGERSTLQKATSLYKKLALRIHPDKCTETGIAKAGGLQTCDRAWIRLTESAALIPWLAVSSSATVQLLLVRCLSGLARMH